MKEFKNGVWTPEPPTEGERVRVYTPLGGYIEKTWSEEVKRNKVVVTSHDKRAVAAVNESINITAEIRNSEGLLLSDFNDSFVMPIQIVGGAVARSVLMTFVNGVCNQSISFSSDGEYQVTEQLINMHLPDDARLDFERFSISIYSQ